MRQLLMALLLATTSASAAGFTVLKPNAPASAAPVAPAAPAAANSVRQAESRTEVSRPAVVQEATQQNSQVASAETIGDPSERFRKLLELPLMKFFVSLATQPAFLENAELLINHPKKRMVFQFEIGFMIALVLFRAWMSSRIKTFLGRVGFNFSTLLAYVLLSGWFIPGIFFGQPYYDVMKTMKKTAQEVYRESTPQKH